MVWADRRSTVGKAVAEAKLRRWEAYPCCILFRGRLGFVKGYPKQL
jgi:hypothetical protein